MEHDLLRAQRFQFLMTLSISIGIVLYAKLKAALSRAIHGFIWSEVYVLELKTYIVVVILYRH